SAIGNTVYDEDDINGEDLNVDWDEDEAQAESPQFPELEAVVRQKINKLGGAIFPKLNWSSPRDASWIALDKTLKCTCPSDIYLLLKSSQFISYDLTKAFVNCEDYEEEKDKINMKYELVLRRWIDLNPALEFRCFVKNNKLFDVFDIYRKDEIPAFRYVEKNDAFQPSPYASYGVPLDIIDLSTGEDPYKLIDFLKLKIQSQNEESSDSEDENNTVHRSHQNT
ncbi:hypothetical protein KUTeg_021116, partial [Tegillarca granosa]